MSMEIREHNSNWMILVAYVPGLVLSVAGSYNSEWPPKTSRFLAFGLQTH